MNERTQARRVIRQRAPLRPAAGAAILPDQFAVDPHPQLFDRNTVIDVIIPSISHTTISEKSTTITILPQHAYRKSIDENVTDLSVVKSSNVIVTIDLDSCGMMILQRVSRFQESTFKRCEILCSEN